MKISLVFNLKFVNNTILSCVFLFFLIFDLHFLIHAVIAKIFNHTVDLAIQKRTPTNEAKARIETQSMTAQTKARK